MAEQHTSDETTAVDPVQERIDTLKSELGPDAEFYWACYRLDANGAQEFMANIYGEDFDEQDFARRHGPGRYMRRFRVKGKRGQITQEKFAVADDSPLLPRPDPITAPTAASGSMGTVGGWAAQQPPQDRTLEVLITMMNNQQQQSTALLTAQMQSMSSMVTAMMTRETSTNTSEVVELLKTVKRMANDEPERDVMGEALTQALSMAQAGQAAMPVQQPTRKHPPGRRRTKPEALPADAPPLKIAGQDEPPADDQADAGDEITAAVLMVITGAEADGDPMLYAQLLIDADTENQLDAAIAASSQGDLAAMMIADTPELAEHAEWLGRLEQALRSMLTPPPGAAELADGDAVKEDGDG